MCSLVCVDRDGRLIQHACKGRIITQQSLNDPQAPETDVRPLPVHDNQVQTVRLDATPGVYGLRWSWD